MHLDEVQTKLEQVALNEMEGMTQINTKWEKVQYMGGEHPTEQEM